eukprot:SAG31_NODE_1525_length_8006_cov_5.106614_8_plen_157_part_00
MWSAAWCCRRRDGSNQNQRALAPKTRAQEPCEHACGAAGSRTASQRWGSPGSSWLTGHAAPRRRRCLCRAPQPFRSPPPACGSTAGASCRPGRLRGGASRGVQSRRRHDGPPRCSGAGRRLLRLICRGLAMLRARTACRTAAGSRTARRSKWQLGR